MDYRKKLLLQAVVILMTATAAAVGFARFGRQSENSVASATLKDKPTVKFKLTKNDSTKTYDGFTMYPVEGTGEVWIVNMKGQTVHRWEVDAVRARLLPNGHLLVIHGTNWGATQERWRALRNKVREYDWDGKIVWEYEPPEIAHHDIRRLANGNTLVLWRNRVPPEYKVKVKDALRRGADIRSDSIREVDPEGRTVWEWNAHEHLDVNSCGRVECTSSVGRDIAAQRLRDWTHINTVYPLPENKWFDKGDTRFRPGNLIILPRNWSTVILIDRITGEPLWQYTGDYKGGIALPHEAQMIPKGLPGEGNLLVFDNGGPAAHAGKSYALEINPVTKEVVWVYDKGREFNSPASGSLMRLPNGNTLISEDKRGRVFEVTADKEIVWELRGDKRVRRAVRFEYDYAPQFKDLAR